MLFYREYGNLGGRLVIFIHGGFTNSESFKKQYDLLEDYHCIFVDLPNYGKSICGDKYQYTFEYAAQAVIEVIDSISPKEKIVLVSHSYGGIVAKLILEKIPDRIEKAVIGSTNIKKTLLFWLYTRKIGCLILMFQNRKRYKREKITWKLVCNTQKSAWKNFKIPDNKRIYNIPALLLYAQYDSQDIKDSMLEWKKCFKVSELVEIKNTGHNYFWDNVEETNQLIREFIIGEKDKCARCAGIDY